MTLNCCIIDDEPLAVRLLESYVLRTPGLNLTATYRSAVAALDGLSETPVDLIFCDIQMPELDGLQFAEILKARPYRIVFTTAFSEYAIDSYRVNALHYLLKPIAYPDFLTAVSKAQEWYERQTPTASVAPGLTDEDTAGIAGVTDDATMQPTIMGDSMFVKSDYRLVRIRFDQILYIEGLKDYVKIYLEGERRPTLSLTSMRTIEAALPADRFQRTHRSFIVNMEQVNTLERGQIVFGDKHIPVSDTYKDVVQQYFAARTLQGRNG